MDILLSKIYNLKGFSFCLDNPLHVTLLLCRGFPFSSIPQAAYSQPMPQTSQWKVPEIANLQVLNHTPFWVVCGPLNHWVTTLLSAGCQGVRALVFRQHCHGGLLRRNARESHCGISHRHNEEQCRALGSFERDCVAIFQYLFHFTGCTSFILICTWFLP